MVVHEYIHLLLNHGTAPLPLWFEEGSAEFYSNLEFSGGRLLVGAPISEHVAALDSAKWLNAAELAEAGITPGLLRVSVGLEDLEDLQADLGAALAAAHRARTATTTTGTTAREPVPAVGAI